MAKTLDDVCCASLPTEALSALAAIRDAPHVQVAVVGSRAIVRWEPGEESVLRVVLPLRGVELFVYRDKLWYRFGHRLPAFDFPSSADYRPLLQVVTPAPQQPLPGPVQDLQPMELTLVPDSQPRPTTAMRCSLAALTGWAHMAPSACLEAIRAARRGDDVLLLGHQLPLLPACQRYWGSTMLVPLGWRAEPNLPGSAIREALGITDGELLLLSAAGAETLPLEAFRTLRREQTRSLAMQAES
jgi:hypothetical protein